MTLGCIGRELCAAVPTPLHAQAPLCTGCVEAGKGGRAGSGGGEQGHRAQRCPPQEREVTGHERVQGPRISAGIGSLQMTVSGKTFQRSVENSARSSLAGQSRALHLSPAQAGFSLHDPMSQDPVLPKRGGPPFDHTSSSASSLAEICGSHLLTTISWVFSRIPSPTCPAWCVPL